MTENFVTDTIKRRCDRKAINDVQHFNNKNKIVLFLMAEIIIQHVLSGKWDLLKMFEGILDFFVSFIPGTI